MLPLGILVSEAERERALPRPFDVPMPALMGVKSLVKRALASAWAEPFVSGPRSRAHATVLMYHELSRDQDDVESWTVVRESEFLSQIEHLRRHYEIVSLDECLARRESATQGDRPLAVVTFDDGDANNHDILLPLVERERVPVTLYVATGHIASGRGYWFDRVINALQVKSPTLIDLGRSELGVFQIGRSRGAGNWAEMQRLLAAMKTLDPGERESLADAIVEQTAGSIGTPAVRPLTIAQVQSLSRSPWITIGAHSHCHNLLTQLTADAVRDSIRTSCRLLSDWTQRPIRHFAYPNGSHDANVVAAVQDEGFASAVSTEAGLWNREDDALCIPRIGVGRYDSIQTFRFNLLGFTQDRGRVARRRATPAEAVCA